jgi:L-fuculose-phosphate aldolase
MMKRVTDTLRDLARACRILVMEGHGDFSLGHLSLRDPDGRGFWLKRNEFGIGEIRSERDFILVSMTGEKLSGEGGRHSEWPIHSAILQARPDVHVVAHTHPAHASVLSASPKGLSPYTLDADYFTAVPRHAADVALIQTADQGASLAATLGPNDAMFLANHGVAFCGRSVAHATCVGVFLERACRAELLGRQLMDDAGFPSPEARATRHSQIMTDQHVQHTWKFLNRKLEALYPDATPVY